MHLEWLETWAFRNLHAGRLDLPDGPILVSGGNGEGKSNLLEAITVLGTLRSFRGARARTMVHHGERAFRVEGRVVARSGATRIRQIVAVGPPLDRELTLDARPAAPATYLEAWPVFALNPADRELVVGVPDGRRAYLDRLLFLLKPGAYDDLRRYRRFLRHRNAALNSGANDHELQPWESGLADAATVVLRHRMDALERLRPFVTAAAESVLGAAARNLELEYRGDRSLDFSNPDEVLVSKYETRYHENRARDRQQGFTGDGPHRHDLRIRVDGRAARETLSAGQAKAVALALRLGAVTLAEEVRGERLPLVVDDIDTELDGPALARLLAVLGTTRQTFLSSARAETFERIVPSRLQVRMRGGSWSIRGPAGDRG